MSCRSKTSLRFCLLAACLWLSGAPAFAQPLTTKPSTNMIVTPCAANAPVMGNGTGASPGCGPTPVRAGDLMYFNGTNWVSLAGNNSGTQILQETSAGVPSWVTVSGTGTVTSVGSAPVRNLDTVELASIYGGGVAVRKDSAGKLIPEAAIYHAVMTPRRGVEHIATRLRGDVAITADRASVLGRIYHRTLAIMIREANL